MKSPSWWLALRLLWRILRSLNRIADALERAYPPTRSGKARAEVLESREETEEEAAAEMSLREGRIPWDPDEIA